MRRREFITLLGGATTWPFKAYGQPSAVPMIGYLDGRSPDSVPHFVSGWRTGLRQTGYIEGRTVTIEARWAEGRFDRLPGLAADLIRRPVDVVFAAGNAAALAAKAAAPRTTPVVFLVGFNPVQYGLVGSLNRPGANVTGVSLLKSEVVSKRLQLLRELVPSAASIGWLANPTNPGAKSDSEQIEIAARRMRVQLHVLSATNEGDIEVAFASVIQWKTEALLVSADVFFDARRDQIVALAARHGLPVMYSNREYVAVGGLMSYGEDRENSYRQAGIYVGRVLKGEKAADLPVQQPTKFELVVNLRTAKALGLAVPPTLLTRADEVIE